MTPPGRKAEVVAWQYRCLSDEGWSCWLVCDQRTYDMFAKPRYSGNTERRELIPAQSLSDMQARLDACKALADKWEIAALELLSVAETDSDMAQAECINNAATRLRTILSRDAATTEETK